MPGTLQGFLDKLQENKQEGMVTRYLLKFWM